MLLIEISEKNMVLHNTEDELTKSVGKRPTEWIAGG